MKKYLVIGNPIGHSLSPLIHNYWMKKYGLIDSVYEKKKVEKERKKRKGLNHRPRGGGEPSAGARCSACAARWQSVAPAAECTLRARGSGSRRAARARARTPKTRFFDFLFFPARPGQPEPTKIWLS